MLNKLIFIFTFLMLMPRGIYQETLIKYEHEKLCPAVYSYLDDKAFESGLSTDLILALIQVESNFNVDLIHKNTNGSYDYGLMQINSVNHKWLQDELGELDFLNPYDSILAGIYMLEQIAKHSKDEHEILMVYNMGRSTYTRLATRGITSSVYSRRIMQIKEE